MKRVRQLLMISFLSLGSFTAAQAANYYVDSAGGSDANIGTSSAAPWQSLGMVNSTAFQPGDTINFKRGSVWTGTLQIRTPARRTVQSSTSHTILAPAPHQKPGCPLWS